jgi:hypothetical protein
MHNPREDHMHALRRILRYIQGTCHYGLHLYSSSTTSLISYTDADCGGCPDTRRYTFGYCVFLEDNLISLSSKQQPTLFRSIAKPNTVELPTSCLNHASYAIFFLSYIVPFTKPPWFIVTTSVQFISLVTRSNIKKQNKIKLDIHFVREKVAHGQV